jgi:hypothetical protein
MHKNQRVSEMAVEVLARQARAQARQTGDLFEDALESVLKTEAGGQLKELRDGPHSGTRAFQWQGDLIRSVGESVSRLLGSSLWLWRLSSGS